MKYTFSFSSSSGEETTFFCDAKSLNDGLAQLASFVHENGFDSVYFSYYYFVEGKKKSQRVFNFNLRNRFWNLSQDIISGCYR